MDVADSISLLFARAISVILLVINYQPCQNWYIFLEYNALQPLPQITKLEAVEWAFTLDQQLPSIYSQLQHNLISIDVFLIQIFLRNLRMPNFPSRDWAVLQKSFPKHRGNQTSHNFIRPTLIIPTCFKIPIADRLRTWSWRPSIAESNFGPLGMAMDSNMFLLYNQTCKHNKHKITTFTSFAVIAYNICRFAQVARARFRNTRRHL